MIKLVNLLTVLKWRIYGGYDPQGPVLEDSPDRAQNRANYEVWKYNTFGPGRQVYGHDYAYQIIDSRELSREPLLINNPWDLAAMASIIAEMEGHKYISMMTPLGTIKTQEDVEREEFQSIYRVVNYYHFDYEEFRDMLEKLKQHNAPS